MVVSIITIRSYIQQQVKQHFIFKKFSLKYHIEKEIIDKVEEKKNSKIESILGKFLKVIETFYSLLVYFQAYIIKA